MEISEEMWDGGKDDGEDGGTHESACYDDKTLVQVVILYRSEIWVMTDEIMTVLEGFHHRIARRIAGMTTRKGNRG